ncbi:MAG: sialate O-acetylesterase, partial [Clostridia bacterium]|nr:sialate O-acetylesterase [Clostridia bacterium]
MFDHQDKMCPFASADGLTHRGDCLRFDMMSLIEFGQRYYKQFSACENKERIFTKELMLTMPFVRQLKDCNKTGEFTMNEARIYAFADESNAKIDDQIIAMKRNNLNGLEIRNVDGQNVSDISLEKAKEVKEKMDKAGLGVWSIGSPIGKID